MDKKAVDRQSAILNEVLDFIDAKYHSLCVECGMGSKGLNTDGQNEFFDKNYKGTLDALFKASEAVGQRIYELSRVNHIS